MTRMMIVLTVFSALAALTHWIFYRSLLKPLLKTPRQQKIAIGVTLALFVFLVGGMALGRSLGPDQGGLLSFAAFIWMGLLIVTVPVLLILEALGLLGRLAARLKDAGPIDLDRRHALSQGIAGLSALWATVAGARSLDNGLSDPVLIEHDIPIKALPPALDGLRIALLSDIHVGPTIGRDFVVDVVKRVNALNPDLVAITGDLVDGSVSTLRDGVEPLTRLKSRFGTFFVTGNHEYYSGVDPWIAELRRLGITVLRNERITLEKDGAALDVLGVDDWEAHRFGLPDHGHDLKRAAAGRDSKRVSLLLAHQPKAIFDAAEHQIDLMVCGHTHGGQLWPGSLLVSLIHPYIEGLHAHNDRTWIYVSRGTGYWGPPMRLGTLSEIALLTLKASTASA